MTDCDWQHCFAHATHQVGSQQLHGNGILNYFCRYHATEFMDALTILADVPAAPVQLASVVSLAVRSAA